MCLEPGWLGGAGWEIISNLSERASTWQEFVGRGEGFGIYSECNEKVLELYAKMFSNVPAFILNSSSCCVENGWLSRKGANKVTRHKAHMIF